MDFRVCRSGKGLDDPAACVQRGVLLAIYVILVREHVSNIKTKLNKTVTAKKAVKKEVVTVAAAPAPTAVEKPATNGGTITLEQVKNVAQTVKALGGFQRMTEVLDVIKESGGVKKFRELAEAISATSTDAIPF